MCWDNFKYTQDELMEYMKRYQEKNKKPVEIKMSDVKMVSSKGKAFRSKNSLEERVVSNPIVDVVEKKTKRKMMLTDEQRKKKSELAKKLIKQGKLKPFRSGKK